jgi:hypothetical protein
VKERLAALGYDLVASTPKEFAARIAAEIEMWAKVITCARQPHFGRTTLIVFYLIGATLRVF